ncbi:Chlorophyllase enzyme [Lachnospira pectinoschiza]|uniref:Chlorophyllase enzyme n=2 Tax=Lachnospira pectinoschiza TaxID=28052 RepID=A0A1G9Y7M4_9FIRM|nr:Chlorophyllase enzyme [Lachnospira pectinoschiza]
MVPSNYTETVETGGELESYYLKNGEHEVAYFEKDIDEDFKKYEVYYPKDLIKEDTTLPVIVTVNGTGVKASKYKTQFKHFASWGFIVIGTEEEESWDGVAAESSLAFLLEENENSESIFYGKIDVNNIGIIGHSQGGAGVFNAITNMEHSNLYKTAISLSPTNEEMAVSLKWSYDVTKINCPIMLLAGTKGDFEMNMVIPTEAMYELYNKISAPKLMARRKGMEHGQMLYSADGYNTAWFMWHLQEDENAAKAFKDNGEIYTNELYQEQKSDSL